MGVDERGGAAGIPGHNQGPGKQTAGLPVPALGPGRVVEHPCKCFRRGFRGADGDTGHAEDWPVGMPGDGVDDRGRHRLDRAEFKCASKIQGGGSDELEKNMKIDPILPHTANPARRLDSLG